MKRTISINKLKNKERDAIIKVKPNVIALIVEEENMRKDQAPKWFTDWTTAFKKENDARWDRQEKFNQLLLSLPTIKKEIEELK